MPDASVTVRALHYRGDGTYYLSDPSHELDGLRRGGPGVAYDRAVPVEIELHGLLASSGGRGAVDLVVAAPKPMSVLLATEGPAAGRALVELHDRSVRATVRYLAEEALHGARPRVVAFTHGINRQCDPHLHSHVLVGALDLDGAAVDVGALRSSTRAADALYLAAMREGLPSATGRRAWCTPRGTVLVEGVDAGIVAASSRPKRRDGTVERGTRKPHPSREEVRRHWDSILSSGRIGLVAEPPAPSDRLDEGRFARALGTGSVSRRDALAAWATACTFGSRPQEVRRAVTLLAPQLATARQPASVLVDGPGVRTLGWRPVEPASLERWLEGRRALERYLASGHSLSHAIDATGAGPATLLAVARLDAALRDVGVPSARRGPLGVVRELS